MSFDYSFSFEPSTPPQFSFEEALHDPSFNPGHRRSGSHASVYTIESLSPTESVSTSMTTPSRSPIRQHGPLLLPKIRPQDQEIHSPVALHTSAPAVKPSHHRSHTNPEAITFTHDLFPSHPQAMSTLCSPLGSLHQSDDHMRRSSSVGLDGQTLGKYGFPTYRQMPTYIPSPSKPPTDMLIAHNVYQGTTTQRTPSPLAINVNFDGLPLTFDDGTTTSLMAYLTSPNPAPALVRQLNIHVRDTNSKHFWWDIRQIRQWTSFSTTSISQISGLQALLSLALPTYNFPVPIRTSSQPETELDLQNIYNTFYATKLNAALALSQGTRHIVMRASTKTSTKAGDPAFISNYTDDTSKMIYGRGFGRVVGLVKSFDRWNTGMRVEDNHRKVEYLRGLSHLHRHMREHGCRYGFIMTEIELVVVRNGGEDTPHFGYLEVQTIQLAAHDEAKTSSSSFSSEVEGSFVEEAQQKPKMTALLALWYLHMLARDTPLPGQPGWKSEIGAPAEGTRHKCMPKDGWMTEPQLAEKREAKRVRGWVWPEEQVGRKELGKRGIRYNG